MDLPDFDLEGRVVIMTGADRGLGRAMSLGLAKKGARLESRKRFASPFSYPYSRCGWPPGSIQRRWYGDRDAAQEKHIAGGDRKNSLRQPSSLLRTVAGTCLFVFDRTF